MSKLGDICEKIENINSSFSGMIEYIDISSVDNEKKVIVSTQELDYSDAPSRAKQLVNVGDILISNVRPNLNAVAMVVEENKNTLVASTGYTVIRCNKNAFNKYVFFFCQYSGFVDKLSSQATGASYPAVNAGIIKNTIIPLPPLETQHKIAATLDKVTHTIDLCNAILEKLDLLVKSRFVEMFGDPINNPLNWKKMQLQDIVTPDCTISYGIVQTGDDQEEGVPVFRPVDIVNRMPIRAELKKTTQEISDKYKRTILKGRELLITVRANIADTYIAGEEFKGCNVGRGIVPIRTDERIIRLEFLKQQIDNEHLNEWIKSKAKGITLIQLNMEDLRVLELIVPPLALQEQFAAFVEQTDKSKLAVKQVLQKAETLKKALMQEYFGS